MGATQKPAGGDKPPTPTIAPPPDDKPADSPDVDTLPPASDEPVPDDRSVSERHDARITEARETLGLDEDGNPKPVPAASKLPPPVYDERGNVRPRGTPGAVPMSYAERVAIAKRLADGETIVTTSERLPARLAGRRTDLPADRVPEDSVIRTSEPPPLRPRE